MALVVDHCISICFILVKDNLVHPIWFVVVVFHYFLQLIEDFTTKLTSKNITFQRKV